MVLAAIASALIWAFEGSVTALIPLYTVGVFIAFTLSQIGLVRHWWKVRAAEPGWRVRIVLNGAGALATGVVTLVVGVSKFTLGAWMVLVLIPLLVAMMWAIKKHYAHWGEESQPETPLDPAAVRLRVIVPIPSLSLPARQALAFAQALASSDQIAVVHVATDPDGANRFREVWQEGGFQTPLVIIESPFRSLLGPLIAFIEEMRSEHPDDTICVVLPEYVPAHWWEQFLHNQTALRLKAALLFQPGVVVTNIPYHLGKKAAQA
ncbi:MAG: hypothetical protein NTZ05_05695 [Chloroflexi bacterium]|nr:hypothetical protein [Chloroflexota bacterium]